MLLKIYYLISLLTFIMFYMSISNVINNVEYEFQSEKEKLKKFLKYYKKHHGNKLRTVVHIITFCMCPVLHLFVLYLFTFEADEIEYEITRRAIQEIREKMNEKNYEVEGD